MGDASSSYSPTDFATGELFIVPVPTPAERAPAPVVQRPEAKELSLKSSVP
jgi:hypothetical protein